MPPVVAKPSPEAAVLLFALLSATARDSFGRDVGGLVMAFRPANFCSIIGEPQAGSVFTGDKRLLLVRWATSTGIRVLMRALVPLLRRVLLLLRVFGTLLDGSACSHWI